jgi:hypothetical protein
VSWRNVGGGDLSADLEAANCFAAPPACNQRSKHQPELRRLGSPRNQQLQVLGSRRVAYIHCADG